MKRKKLIKTIIYAIAWLIIWQVLSLIISNKIMFVGPVETFLSLISMIPTSAFWISILNTLLRIVLGYILGACLGIILSSISYKFSFIDDFLSPVLLFLKAVPVASFVIILLIWMGNKNLSVIISTMIVFPIIYSNTLTGLKNANKKLIEMSNVFHMRFIDKVRFLYYPEIKEQLKTSMVLSSGMAWKSGVAAEVIAQPLQTIGNNMYVSKIYLDTDKLFAWTIVIIVLSKLFEFLISLIFGGKKHDRNA